MLADIIIIMLIIIGVVTGGLFLAEWTFGRKHDWK